MQIVSRQPSDINAPRVGALSVLPVFFSLAGKTVIVVGASDAAAWKAELLASAGADVTVYAPQGDVSEEMADLGRHGAAAGSITLENMDWRTVDFTGAALVVGDIDDEDAAEFAVQVRAAGVPVNVIDKPAFCDFQFGSIVNRSPVVVGISTAGAAPILGQAVRQRIETLLPATLGAWGALAQNLRAKIMERLKPGAERRAFWERFVDRSFSGAPAIEADMYGRTGDGQGRVTLVGAGPGDAELLTLKAMRALQSADVILFDDLVSNEVLELARREARRLCVGKRGGRESCRQEDINDMMLTLARQGRHVVRLKSGDPMIFGRAGEEIEALEAQGIAVSVVPGISAAMALASRLGISLTHRDHARSVRFVTGHSRKGELPDDLDWRGLADPAVTNVYYMCRRTLPAIQRKLSKNGMPADTPVTIAANVGRADEKIWTGSLADIKAGQHGFKSGDVMLFATGHALRQRAQNLPEIAPAQVGA